MKPFLKWDVCDSKKAEYLLDVIVQTPHSEVGNVIVFVDFFRILLGGKAKRINSADQQKC